jgi:hypothetical protein
MHFHLAPKNPCGGFLGQVVGSGAKSAAGDHQIGAVKGGLQVLGKALGIVTYHALTIYADAKGGKTAGKIGGVGVDNVADQQLCANAQDLGTAKLTCGHLVHSLSKFEVRKTELVALQLLLFYHILCALARIFLKNLKKTL